MFRKTLNHQPSKISFLEKVKAGILCLLMVLVTAPDLHALTKCADPYETNCVVTMGPLACGNGGSLPCWIKYDLTVNDSTPGAQIHYMAFEGPYEIDAGYVSSGQHIIETVSYSNGGYGLSMNGYMYATASDTRKATKSLLVFRYSTLVTRGASDPEEATDAEGRLLFRGVSPRQTLGIAPRGSDRMGREDAI